MSIVNGMCRKYLERIILSWPGYAQVTVVKPGHWDICHFNSLPFNDRTFYLRNFYVRVFRNPLRWLGFIITQIVKLVPVPLLATSLLFESSEIRSCEFPLSRHIRLLHVVYLLATSLSVFLQQCRSRYVFVLRQGKKQM